ncbi:uncharacterized protein LOC115742836 [Rhodamnia argentea]|uniref:Uncharacterized protein LOC115742836 n=1 Tax=Rhodamnia argentea TaxID=178133 RepID=A0ABM3H1K6_9MYRT|nr:uncharacterized protein LOC115742836 [Rhodamnia argentea]
MDSGIALSPEAPEPRADGSASPTGEKRGALDGGTGGSAVPTAKKPRFGRADFGRVAEIVLVLAAMGRMRGGRDPTEAELGLMMEAREKLASVCATLAPEDIVAGDAIGRVIEDLGLNGKPKEQRLGYTVPKLSIAEKLTFAKRKMEESKKFTSHTASYSPHSSPTSFVATAENRGMAPLVRPFPSDKVNQSPLSSGVIPVSSATANVSSGSSAPYQLQRSEIKTSTASSVISNSHIGRDSSPMLMPKVDQANNANHAGPHNLTKPSQATYANQPSVNAPSWSLQTQHALLSRLGTGNSIPSNTLGQVEQASTSGSAVPPLAARNPTNRPFTAQTAAARLPAMHHQSFQGVNFVSAPSSYASHYEIAKIIQKLLTPKLPEHPTWTPPSREYMNKALICQLCQATVTDVESVLLCDACEKGFHFKCLQSQNQKGIPKAEWHCQKCLALSHGKALPPKYGRVMRNLGGPKVAPTATASHSYSERKVRVMDSKSNQPKIATNGVSYSQNAAVVITAGKNHVNTGSDLQIPKAREMRENNLSSSKKEGDQKPFSESGMNSSVKSLDPICGSPLGLLSERSKENREKYEPFAHFEQECHLKSELPAGLCESANIECSLPSSSHGVSDVKHLEKRTCTEVSSKMLDNNDSTVKGAEKSSAEDHQDSTSTYDVKQVDQDDRWPDHVQNSDNSTGKRECVGFSTDIALGVEWVGDALEVVNGKTFYSSCCVGGVTYKVKEHALFRLSNDKLTPFKLQAMWEDSGTGLKWFDITRCYFPGDLPNNVAHPFVPDSNEVFESNHDSSAMACLIQGPCDVLPPAKFKEETERRSHIGSEANVTSRPLFLCNWFYDELKGHFQAVSI